MNVNIRMEDGYVWTVNADEKRNKGVFFWDDKKIDKWQRLNVGNGWILINVDKILDVSCVSEQKNKWYQFWK